MIAYRDVVRELGTTEELRRLLELIDCGSWHGSSRGETEDLLIGVGELEQGITDALHPQIDVWDPLQAQLREAVCAAASAHLAAASSEPQRRGLTRVGWLLERLEHRRLPPKIAIKAPEGYLHYAIDPTSYAGSAAAYAGEVGRALGSRACVIGVRSIGTSLSAIVAAALGGSRSITVRPRGPSGRRQVSADESLRAQVVADEQADVLIVDEGPGATGETFACVAAWVESLGVDPKRIVLFSHHESGLALAPNGRRRWFARQRRYTPPAGDDGLAETSSALGLQLVEDLSAGRWRAVVPDSSTLPACSHHERRKHLARGEDGRSYVLRYVGRGRWGRAAIDRALQLAELGIGPELLGWSNGFVATRWIEGRPVRSTEARSPAFHAAACGYLVARAGRCSTGELVDDTPVLTATLENTREALGPEPVGLADAIRRIEELPRRPAVIADARMLAHEWLSTPGGYFKTDTVDHGDDIRPPGPSDAAWDLAGAAVEYALDDATIAALCSRCAPACDRSTKLLARAVAAYRVPYTACCLGEMTLSAREAATSIDRQRLADAAAIYLRKLRRELERIVFTLGGPS